MVERKGGGRKGRGRRRYWPGGWGVGDGGWREEECVRRRRGYWACGWVGGGGGAVLASVTWDAGQRSSKDFFFSGVVVRVGGGFFYFF